MKIRLPLVLLASLIVAFLAVSHDSFWIDEAFTAHFAVPPDLGSWWHTLYGALPDGEMPLYMFYIWAWEKVAGGSEWAYRAANIPWFLLAQAAFWVGLRRWPRVQLAAVICAACNPFLWRYIDEARPYAMQYSGAAIVVSCLAWLGASAAPVISASWIAAFGTGIFILCGSCALGVPWAGAAVLAGLCLIWRRARFVWSPSSVAAILTWLVALGGLGAYYFWIVTHSGPGGWGIGQQFSSLCFAVYELLGFSGLGPSRISVSDAHAPGIFFPYLGTLVPLAVLLGGTLVIAARAFWRAADSRMIGAALLYAVPPVLLLILMVCVKSWHAVGRHFTPISPVVVMAVALGVAAAWRERSRWQMGWTAAFVLLWLGSSLKIRFAAQHRRDDYRDAAGVASAALAQGKRVWWIAAYYGGTYYHLPLTHGEMPVEGNALYMWQPTSEHLAELPPPDMVLVSKPVLSDQQATVAGYLDANHYHKAGGFPAFTIWEK